MKWYITIGIGGGELACKSNDPVTARSIITSWYEQMMKPFAGADLWATIAMRPAPPDLSEWLDKDLNDAGDQAEWSRMKVPGGWIYQGGLTEIFVPVAGAGGITVISD